MTSPRLAIDFGNMHTVAAINRPDGRIEPLMFDASFLLPSSVYADTDGRILVGEDAVRSAQLDPTRFEPNPKRRIDDRAMLLGSREYPVIELVGAVLRRVGDEASRVVGVLPATTVLTYPAAWAAPRRAVLASAAVAARLPAVTLVPEPVAAACYFTTVLGHTVPPGGAIVAYDFGGGTFDVSVLRRGPAGWEILASDGIPDLGGVDLDGLVVEYLAGVVGMRDPQRWQWLNHSPDDGARRSRQALWDAARSAKEQLTRASSAAMRVPVFEVDVHLTREEFERIVRPHLERTVDLTATALQRTGVRADRLAGVFPVGGSSRIPLVSTLLHHRLGVAPILIEQPELVVALGAHAAMPGGDRSAPVSAPPAPPLSSLASGPVMMPPPGPVTGPTFGVVTNPEDSRSTRRRAVWLAAAALALVLLGLGAVQGYRALSSDAKEPGSTSGNQKPDRASSGDGRGDNTGGTGNAKAGAAKQSVNIGKTAWYAGYKFTFGTATYDQSQTPQFTIEAVAENLGTKNWKLAAEPTFAIGTTVAVNGDTKNTPLVPAGQKTNVAFVFILDRFTGSIADGTLTFGDGAVNQTVVPLGSNEGFVAHEPRKVLENVKVTVNTTTTTLDLCELRADHVADYKQAPKGYLTLACSIQGAYGGPYTYRYWREDAFRLKLTDGTTVGPVIFPLLNLYKGEAPKAAALAFDIKEPAEGQYTLQVVAAKGSGGEANPDVKEIQVTLPAGG